MHTKRPVIFFSLFLLLFLLLLSYKFVLGITAMTSVQEKVLEYLNNEGQLPNIFTKEEASHFADVKIVMQRVEIMFYILLLVVTLMITSYMKDKGMLQKLFKYGGITTVISLLVFSFLTFFAFDWLFTQFHHIIFPQGNWQFPASSVILQTFPFSFFVEVTRNIAITTFILGILFIVVSRTMNHDTQSTRH